MFVFLLIFASILGVIHIIFNYNARARMFKKIPGPKYAFIVGNGLEIIQTPVELMKLARKWSLKWKGIFRVWSFPIGAVSIYNPEDIEIVISSMKNNDKGFMYKFLTPWLRNGLVVSGGQKWQQRRKLLTPTFHFNILRKFYIILQENSQRLVERLDKSLDEPVAVERALSEYTLNCICGGYTIPAKTLCNIHIIDLHRSPHLYKDPLVFDPDRFLPENCVGRHPYAYIPFSAGPRNCIGQKFAMMEMKSAISEILRKFVLKPVTHPDDIEFRADLVLRNVQPVYITFSRR